MEGEQIRGRADAEAARIYAEAYSQDADFYEFIRTLQAYETTFDKNTVAILSADSVFLRLLNQAEWPEFVTNPAETHDERQPTTRPVEPE